MHVPRRYAAAAVKLKTRLVGPEDASSMGASTLIFVREEIRDITVHSLGEIFRLDLDNCRKNQGEGARAQHKFETALALRGDSGSRGPEAVVIVQKEEDGHPCQARTQQRHHLAVKLPLQLEASGS